MKQITEDYVSYEMAKLLKEKGFPQEEYVNLFPYYTQNGNLYFGDINTVRQRYCVEVVASSQSFALKWLREVHSIYITSEPDINDKHCFYPVIYTMTEESWDMQCFEELEELSFDKPEQAVEAACLWVLKNLI